MYKRKILEKIDQWRKTLALKKRALIVRGLRQVGKTTIVSDYCKKNYQNVIYLNFMEQTSLKKIFDQDLIVNNLIRDLSANMPGTKFIPNKTVIIFDEIQECANARTAIKPFMLDGRFDIVATGSLLDLRGYNKKGNKGIPTGFEYQIQMCPMDFEEFLWARGVDEELIGYIKECYINKTKVSETVNDAFMSYFKEYLCVGGLPDAVNTFLKTNDLNQVFEVEKGILEDYKDDFGKHLNQDEKEYQDKSELTRIMEVYDSIPSQLAKENKKFQYSTIGKKAKGREYRFALTWLAEFGLCNLCYNLNNLELPLEGNKNPDCFKLYVSDAGLFCAMLGFDAYKEILDGNLGIYKGAIYENAIAETLAKNGINLYYFSKSSGFEIDFITKMDHEIVPLEVKGKNGNSKSLKELLKNKDYSINKAIKLVNGNIGEMNNIYTIPLYMCFLIK